MAHFIIKKGQNKRTYNKFYQTNKQEKEHIADGDKMFDNMKVNGNVLDINPVTNLNKNEKEINMDTQEKIMMANAILNQAEATTKVKKVRKDKGLIEKTESSKIILTEDNRELLND